MAIFLTADNGVFLGPIAKIFGYLMNGIYLFLDKINIGSIGLAIIIFTLITRIILFPFTVKQQKSSKLMAVIQPEIKAIQDKYKGLTDQQSMMAQQSEIRQVYEKYGTSMTGSCVQLLIQMPIIFALYRVIMNIPAYVPTIKDKFSNIISYIGSDAVVKITEFANSTDKIKKIASGIRNFKDILKFDVVKQKDLMIDFLYKLNTDNFNTFASNFANDIKEKILVEHNYIEQINSFLTLDLASAPSEHGFLSKYIIVPILAGVSQYASVLIMQKQTKNKNADDENNQMAQTMKSMNIMMPIMSAFFCYSFATGIGIYWIASSIFMVISQVIINKHLDKMDINELIKQNIEKANKKRAKKGLPPINAEKTAKDLVNREQKVVELENERKDLLDNQKKHIDEADKFYFENEDKDSLFAKANMVKKYNEKHNK